MIVFKVNKIITLYMKRRLFACDFVVGHNCNTIMSIKHSKTYIPRFHVKGYPSQYRWTNHCLFVTRSPVIQCSYDLECSVDGTICGAWCNFFFYYGTFCITFKNLTMQRWWVDYLVATPSTSQAVFMEVRGFPGFKRPPWKNMLDTSVGIYDACVKAKRLQ